mmetsp:Transcript_49196/g.129759  ORF Transcript_49196/g.129759 Transcript_49196/m.129759 type:complete len:97 (+) Transcript_49196:284-574(+)
MFHVMTFRVRADGAGTYLGIGVLGITTFSEVSLFESDRLIVSPSSAFAALPLFCAFAGFASTSASACCTCAFASASDLPASDAAFLLLTARFDLGS